MKPINHTSKAIISTLIACFVLTTTQLLAAEIDPDTGEGYVKLNRKLHCSTVDGEETTYYWWGRVYSRVTGERDKHLFNVEGMNVRQCVTVEDKEKGTGYRLISRELMLYLDPKTSEILRSWENPWTDEVVEVIHVANDPVNGRPDFPIGRDGKEKSFGGKMLNGTYFLNFEVPLFYSNPLGGEYQKHIGGTYHGTEIFDFNGNTDTLLDADTNIDYANISWVRIAQWLPWMNMNGRNGIMYFNAVGKKLQNWDQLSDLMKDEIAKNYPEYTNAPPADDARPNETSWTYMKKIIDKRRSESGESDKKKGH